MSVSVKDTGWKNIAQLVAKLAQEKVEVVAGVLEGPPRAPVGPAQNVPVRDRETGRMKKRPPKPEPLTNVQLAIVHEFGTDTLPERSFIRASYAKGQPLYEKMAGDILKKCLESQGKKRPKDLLPALGMKMASDIKNYIVTSQVRPVQSPATAKRKAAKGSAQASAPTTLVDTGQLLKSVTWLVRGETK